MDSDSSYIVHRLLIGPSSVFNLLLSPLPPTQFLRPPWTLSLDLSEQLLWLQTSEACLTLQESPGWTVPMLLRSHTGCILWRRQISLACSLAEYFMVRHPIRQSISTHFVCSIYRSRYRHSSLRQMYGRFSSSCQWQNEGC